MDCTSLALQVAPVSYYCSRKIIGLRPKLGNTYYHIIKKNSILTACMPLKVTYLLDVQDKRSRIYWTFKLEVHDLFIGRLTMAVHDLFIGRLRWKFMIYLVDA